MTKKTSSSSDFEVAKGPGMGEGSTKESFGGAPPKISVGGGTMATFGHRAKGHGGQEVWPSGIVSPDVKTGYPKNFDGKSKKSKAQ